MNTYLLVFATGLLGGGIAGFLAGIINVTGAYERAAKTSTLTFRGVETALPVVRGEAHDRQQPTFYNLEAL